MSQEIGEVEPEAAGEGGRCGAPTGGAAPPSSSARAPRARGANSPHRSFAGCAVSTEGLTKDYGEGRGLFDLDLEIHSGEIFGFLGPNGAGKTTTMRLLLDLIRPTAGRATVLGLDAGRRSREVRSRVGYLPGDLTLYRQLTGERILDYPASLNGGSDARRRGELAERLEADLERPVRELSSGNRQKIGLIQAFMHEPELLILDEPTAGLDPLVQQSFHELLGETRDAGRTVFLSSHTLSEVERVADRVGVLREGRLVVVDTLADLREVAVKRLEIEFAAPPSPGEFRVLEGVREVEAAGRELRVAFEGAADTIVKAAAAHEVIAVRSREPDLEEIFLRYYQDGDTR